MELFRFLDMLNNSLLRDCDTTYLQPAILQDVNRGTRNRNDGKARNKNQQPINQAKSGEVPESIAWIEVCCWHEQKTNPKVSLWQQQRNVSDSYNLRFSTGRSLPLWEDLLTLQLQLIE